MVRNKKEVSDQQQTDLIENKQIETERYDIELAVMGSRVRMPACC
jgi:hypothetical protein